MRDDRDTLLSTNMIGEEGLARTIQSTRNADIGQQAVGAAASKQLFMKRMGKFKTAADAPADASGIAPGLGLDGAASSPFIPPGASYLQPAPQALVQEVVSDSGSRGGSRSERGPSSVGMGASDDEERRLGGPGTLLPPDEAPILDVQSRRSYVRRIMRSKHPFAKGPRELSMYEYVFDEHSQRISQKLSLDLVLAIDWHDRRKYLHECGCSERSIKSIVEGDIRRIIKGLLDRMDEKEKYDVLTTDTDAFLMLYAEYDTFVADQAPLEEKLERYPQIVFVTQTLSKYYSATYDNDIATDLAAQALDLIIHYHVRQIMYVDEMDVYAQWKALKEFASKRRLSGAGKIEYLDRMVEYTKSRQQSMNVAIERARFMKKIEKDMKKISTNHFERIVGMILAMCAVAFLAFLFTRCYVEAWCDTDSQNFVVLAHTFDFSPPLFGNAQINPCQKSCTLFTPECVCSSVDLTCSAGQNLGDTCTCTQPACDRCNVCGLLWKLLRQYTFWILFVPPALHIILLFLATSFISFPDSPLTWDMDEDAEYYRIREANLETVNIIIAHQVGSKHDLERTLKAALEIVRPVQIIVCHYGPTSVPYDDKRMGETLSLCSCLTEAFYEVNPEESRQDSGKIQYCWAGTESRMLAIYMTCLAKCQSRHVMLLKDDCVLPRELFCPVNWFKEDYHVSGIGFFTRSDHLTRSDGSPNRISILQDLSSRIHVVESVWQSLAGSMYFPSKQVSLWNRRDLLKMLERHDCSAIGEDIQMGIILHKLHQANRIKCAANVAVPVAEPTHLWCCPFNTPLAKSTGTNALGRFLLAPFKCKEWGCAHKRESVFANVARTTNANYHYLFPSISVLLYVWNRNTSLLKLFIIADLLEVIMDVLRVPLVLYVFLVGDQSYWLEFAFWLGFVYVLYVLTLTGMEVWTFRDRLELQSGFWTILLYPFFCFLKLVFRQISVFFSIPYLVSHKTTSTRIMSLLRLPIFVDGQHLTLSSDDIPACPTFEEVSLYKRQTRHLEIHGLKRVGTPAAAPTGGAASSWELLRWDNVLHAWIEDEIVAEDETRRMSTRAKRDPSALLFLLLIPLVGGAVLLALQPVFTMFQVLTVAFGAFTIICVVLRLLFQ